MTDKRANCEHKLYPLQHVDNKDKCDYCGTPVDIPHEPLDAWQPIFVNGVIPDEFRAWIAAEVSKAYEAGQHATLLDASAYKQGYTAGRIAEGKTCEAAGRHDYRRAVIDAQIEMAGSLHRWQNRYFDNALDEHLDELIVDLEAQKTKLNRNPALKETNPTEVPRANTALNCPKSEGENHSN